jgi:hypothetical protein
MKLKNNKKYNCSLCGTDRETNKNKINFCVRCRKIKDYINLYGVLSVLDKIEMKASAPPYNN